MNRARLETLHDFLTGTGKYAGKGVPKEKFHLSVFMGSYAGTADTIFRSAYKETAVERRFKEMAKTAAKGKKSAFKTVGKAMHQYWQKDVKVLQPVKCQTAGCACGWATTIPAFYKAGLRLVESRNSFAGTVNVALIENGKIIYTGFDAAAAFFDIGAMDAYQLFDPAEYNDRQHTNPLAVAKRIRQLIKQTDKEEADDKAAYEAMELLR